MGSRIMCANIFRGVDTYSEDTIVNFTFSNAVNGSTALQAGFAKDADREVVFDLGKQISFNSMCYAKHNLADADSNIEVYSGTTVTGPWVLEYTSSPSTNNVKFHLLTKVTTRYLKLTVTTSSIDRYIGNLSLGIAHYISDGQYIGFVQPDYAPTHKLISNVTRGGEIAGIIRQEVPVKTKIEAKHLDKDWLDENWSDLNECITTYPFYFLWEPGAAAVYCWAKKINPPTWSSISRLQFSIEAEGFL